MNEKQLADRVPDGSLAEAIPGGPENPPTTSDSIDCSPLSDATTLSRECFTLHAHELDVICPRWAVDGTVQSGRGFVMKRVTVDLSHCYGIKALKWDFDFARKAAYALYAPNGVMKSSLAQTFLDASKKQDSRDRIFPAHKTVRNITDEAGAQIDGERVLVVVPYDEALGPNEQTSVLLVNQKLREEHAKLFIDINELKDKLLAALREQAKSKTDFEVEISAAFTSGDDIYTALGRIKDEIRRQKEAVFKNVEYEKIFNEKVAAALSTKNLKDAVENYIERYNELLDNSVFFRKGTFDYYNAGQIADSLAKNGFFEAKHTVHLKSVGKTVEINTQEELEALITEEKQKILTDSKLLKNFDAVAKQLSRNAELREFCRYLQSEVKSGSCWINGLGMR